MLYRLHEAIELINSGAPLMVAGSSEMMSRLPRGNWIGGTAPRFVTKSGGVEARDMLFILKMPADVELLRIQRYGMGGLHYLTSDAADDGFTLLIMPYGSLVHQTYAREAPKYSGILAKTITGWVSGVGGERFGERPQVFFGPNAHCIEDEVVAMHMSLPPGVIADVETTSVYEQGDGDVITFDNEGFFTTHAFVNGRKLQFAEYLDRIGAKLNRPLVGNFCGMRLNVSLRRYDVAVGQVSFFAPVFRNVEYRIAKPINDIQSSLRNNLPRNDEESAFCCICNTVYMDGALGSMDHIPVEGPVVFGEIAHLLTSQTVTRLRLHR